MASSRNPARRASPRVAGWAAALAGLSLGALALPAQAGIAQSYCALKRIVICRETGTNVFTGGQVSWSDESVTHLTPSGGTVTASTSGSVTTTTVVGLTNGTGLTSTLGSDGVAGQGTAAVGSLTVDTGSGAVAPPRTVDLHLGQANSEFLDHGSGGNDLHFVSQSQSDFGLNRASLSVFGNVNADGFAISTDNRARPGYSGWVQPSMSGSVESTWSDTVDFIGGAGTTVSFEVEVDGTRTPFTAMEYVLQAIDADGNIQNIVSADVGDQATPGSLGERMTGSLTLGGAASNTYVLQGWLEVFVQAPDSFSAAPVGAGPIKADFFDTARIDAIDLSAGTTATYGSGSANLIGVTHVLSVPEPGSWELLLGGVALLVAVRAARRRA